MQCTALCLLISSWLSVHGFADAQRQAVLRNIRLESRFEACVSRGPGGSAYLLQWLGPRRRALARFAHTNSCPTWQDQLQFATMELMASKYTVFWKTKDASVAFHEFREHFGRGR